MKALFFISVFILASVTITAQDVDTTFRDVSLKIVDKKSRPIQSIVVHTTTGTQTGMTDHNGLYVFRNLSDNDSLTMLLPKYGETVIPVSGMDSIVVTLRSAQRMYYRDLGTDLVYEQNKMEPSTQLDVQSILQKNNYSSLYDLLQGRVAGLNLTQSGSGEIQANIRGQRSFLLSSEPLVVLDGIPIGTLSEANSMINVRDIKTIEVLKSGSEYGVRGANGVILIKTRTE